MRDPPSGHEAPAPAVDTTPPEVSRELAEMFLRAEQSGLKLATLGRTAALVLLGIWLVGSRALGSEKTVTGSLKQAGDLYDRSRAGTRPA